MKWNDQTTDLLRNARQENQEQAMRVLVDLDGVLADFEEAFLRAWKENFPEHVSIPTEERVRFSLVEEYPIELKEHVRSIYQAPGFYRRLAPVAGGRDALQEMLQRGIDVWICTSPILAYRNCVLEKYEWVEEFLGSHWTAKIILTRDKTIIDADILIDDKPGIQGVAKPKWEHILYDQPYNRNITDQRRVTWKTWKIIFGIV